MTRAEMLLKGIDIGKTRYGIPKSKYTAMYQAILTVGYDDEGEPDVSTGIEEKGNYCSICMFLDDEPYNFGEIIEPSSYDADCDECGKMALPYAHENDDDYDGIIKGAKIALHEAHTDAKMEEPTEEETQEFLKKLGLLFGLSKGEEE